VGDGQQRAILREQVTGYITEADRYETLGQQAAAARLRAQAHLLSGLPGPRARCPGSPLSRPGGSFAYAMTRSLSFTYQITKIMSDMSDMSHHLVSKGVKVVTG